MNIWILLVEDDPIFARLFCRCWLQAYPQIAVQVAGDLATMNSLLGQTGAPPRLIVMDRSLPDGNGHDLASGLPVQTYCWSACAEGGVAAKPQGKSALEASVQQLAALAGLQPGNS